MVSLIEEIQVRKHELDQQLAAEQAKENLAEFSALMADRKRLQIEVESDLSRLKDIHEGLKGKLLAARTEAEQLEIAVRRSADNYVGKSRHWDSELSQLDRQLLDLRPESLNQFLEWLRFFGEAQLGRFHDPANPLWGRVEMPTYTQHIKRRGLVNGVDTEVLEAQNELRRVAEGQALALGLSVAPAQFEDALAKLRADTEQELEALRVSKTAKEQGRK